MTDHAPSRAGNCPRTAALLLVLLVCCLGYIIIERMTRSRPETEEPFAKIYKDKLWGANEKGEGHSGGGSTLRATVVYRAYLQEFLKEHRIRTVVDAGCGDWEFSQSLNWSGIDYKGYDIVPAVIEKNRKLYSAPNVQFFTANIVEADLPAADLLICKHVLQHIPNRDVAKFCAQLPKYKHVLLINGVDAATFSANNSDIEAGHYRPLDVTRAPFSLPGKKVLNYWDGVDMHQIVHLVRQ